MPEPAAAGVLIYAKNLQALAHFYQQVLGMKELQADADIVVQESPAL